jgi:hypothetical protein
MIKGGSVKRQGIQALYTFTPFKLLEAKPEEYFTLLLTPLARFKNPPNLKWRSKGYKESFTVSFLEEGLKKKVVHPYLLFSVKLQRGCKDCYVYEREDVRKEDSWRFPPTYIEFSWSSLSSAYHCKLGWILLSSQSRCPYEGYCPDMKGSPCPWYSTKPTSYSRLYNVFPRIQKRFEDPTSDLELLPVMAIRYKNRPLIIVRFTESGSFLAFIDGVIFSPKIPWILAQPVVFLEEKLGFRLRNVHAIELEFIPEVLEELIKDILLSNKEIARWIILKYRLYMGASKRQDYIYERRGFRAFEELEKVVSNAVQGLISDKSISEIVRDVQSGEVNQEIIDFASFLLLHSLAHTLKSALVAKFGCDVDDLEYYVEHSKLYSPSPFSGKTRIILLETAAGGFGYIKNFVNEVKETSNINIFKELIKDTLYSFIMSCEKKVEESLRDLENQLRPFQEESKELVDLILKAYRSSFPNTKVFPHIFSVRRVLSKVSSASSSEERSLLDDLIARAPHCWDGCQLCVAMERGCHFLPFDQPFLISEKLLRASLDKLLEMIEHPDYQAHLKRGVVKEFETLLSIAKSKIDLASPWLSREVVEHLLKVHREKGLKIRVLTAKDPNNEMQARSLEMLAHISRNNPGFQTRTIEGLHAKGMLVDGIILLHGSFNFTISGLSSNIESVALTFDIRHVQEFKEKFDKLWNNAEHLI